MRYPDSPALISLDMLVKLDKDPPGTWLAQTKIDGRRRMIYKDAGKYTWVAKNKGDSMPVPADLRDEFERLPWPDGIGLDCEWFGPRDVKGEHKMYILDLLVLSGEWYGQHPYAKRCADLYDILNPHICGPDDMWMSMSRYPRIKHTVNARMDFVRLFEQEKRNPVSEGLVIRKATSTIIGNRTHSATNPEMLKVKFERSK